MDRSGMCSRVIIDEEDDDDNKNIKFGFFNQKNPWFSEMFLMESEGKEMWPNHPGG